MTSRQTSVPESIDNESASEDVAEGKGKERTAKEKGEFMDFMDS